MNEEEFNNKLQELIRTVADLPTDEQKQNQHKIEVDKIIKSLTDLRICIKYLIFDLEATRRERDQFKKKLEQLPDNDDEPNRGRMD